jgi:putative membrane protein
MRGRKWKESVMWWDHDIGWAGWLAMAFGMGGFWILVALLVVGLVRSGRPASPGSTDPREILERRLARGEIDVEEYQQRLDALIKAPR